MLKEMKKNRGFTLIELMIVIAIISIISVAVLTVLNPADQIAKANDARRKSDLLQIQKSLEQYYEDNGRYPGSSNNEIEGTNNSDIGWGTPWVPYMNLLPQDPSSPGKNYVYAVDNSGQYYYLYASLDRGAKDSQACNNGDACSKLGSLGLGDTACGDICNYGVTSPNTSP